MGHAGGKNLPTLPQCCGFHPGPQVLLGFLKVVSSYNRQWHNTESKLLVFAFREPFSSVSLIPYFSSWVVFSGNGQTLSFWSSLKTVISTSQSGIPEYCFYLFIYLSDFMYSFIWIARQYIYRNIKYFDNIQDFYGCIFGLIWRKKVIAPNK